MPVVGTIGQRQRVRLEVPLEQRLRGLARVDSGEAQDEAASACLDLLDASRLRFTLDVEFGAD